MRSNGAVKSRGGERSRRGLARILPWGRWGGESAGGAGREGGAYLGVEVDDAGHAGCALGRSDRRGGGDFGRDEGGEAGDGPECGKSG